VPAEPGPRTEEEIRREIAAEREQLAGSLADLRASVEAKKRPVSRAAGAVAAGVAALVALKLVRLIRR
jgi:hypothetical protein